MLPVRTHRVVPDQPAEEEEAATAEVCSVLCASVVNESLDS